MYNTLRYFIEKKINSFFSVYKTFQVIKKWILIGLNPHATVLFSHTSVLANKNAAYSYIVLHYTYFKLSRSFLIAAKAQAGYSIQIKEEGSVYRH